MSDLNQSPTPIQNYEQPLVTIGIPTYNRPEGLRKTLERVLKQTYPNLEVVISDNCSGNPEVQKITAEFSARDKRIKVFRQSVNIGLENNFNFVYSMSGAPYFIWMSDDDLFDANYIEECVKFLEENPDYVLCSGVVKYNSDGQDGYKETMFKVDQSSISSRLYHYFSSVQKNGIFYGVFRNKLILERPLRPHIGCDISFVAQLAVFGKLSYVDSTSIQRSAEGNSENRKKMVRGLGLFKNMFFETYFSYIIATGIFNVKEVNQKLNWVSRKLLTAMVFFQFNWKLLVKFLKKVFLKKRGV